MVTAERLRHKQDDMDREIEDLQETRQRVYADSGLARDGVGWLQKLVVSRPRRDLTGQMRHLELPRRIAQQLLHGDAELRVPGPGGA